MRKSINSGEKDRNRGAGRWGRESRANLLKVRAGGGEKEVQVLRKNPPSRRERTKNYGKRDVLRTT